MQMGLLSEQKFFSDVDGISVRTKITNTLKRDNRNPKPKLLFRY